MSILRQRDLQAPSCGTQAAAMKRAPIHSSQAPAAVAAYSQAIRVEEASQTLYCSGQIALDPVSGEMIGGGDVAAECQQVLKNLAAVLQEAGMEPKDIVRATIFLTDMEDFAAVNKIYAAWVAEPAPARACVAVRSLPRGAKVEIDAIACR